MSSYDEGWLTGDCQQHYPHNSYNMLGCLDNTSIMTNIVLARSHLFIIVGNTLSVRKLIFNNIL